MEAGRSVSLPTVLIYLITSYTSRVECIAGSSGHANFRHFFNKREERERAECCLYILIKQRSQFKGTASERWWILLNRDELGLKLMPGCCCLYGIKRIKSLYYAIVNLSRNLSVSWVNGSNKLMTFNHDTSIQHCVVVVLLNPMFVTFFSPPN